MVEKAYNSAQYYAQTFRDYLDNAFKLGHTFKPKQKGDEVHFDLMRRGVIVRFGVVGESPRVTLEVQASNGTWVSSDTRHFRVKKSQHERVSDKTYEGLYKGHILPFFKSVYAKSADNKQS